MKSYEQMAQSVLARRDKILRVKQQKKNQFFKYAARVSSACAAIALCIGAVAVWSNIKDTQKDLDELVRPEDTTRTTVSQPDSNNGNNNANDNNAVQDSTEAVTPTEKVIVTSISKNKDGKNVIVTTEVAVPVNRNSSQQDGSTPLPPEFVSGKNSAVTAPGFIGPQMLVTKKTSTVKPSVTTVSKAPIHTNNRSTTAKPNNTPVINTTTKANSPDNIHTDPPVHTTVTHSAVMTHTTVAHSHEMATTIIVTKPAATNPPDAAVTTHGDKELPADMPAETTQASPQHAPGNNDAYDIYRSFELNGRYFNYMNENTHSGEVTDMTLYYSGTATFYDNNHDQISKEIDIYAYPGSYRAVVFIREQYRYSWFSISTPFQ